MDWLTFIARMTGALAWPLAAVFIVTFYRHQIAAILRRVTRVTTPLGGLEAEAQTTLREADELFRAEATTPSPDEANGEGPEDEATERQSWLQLPDILSDESVDRLDTEIQRLKVLARIAPAEAVKTSWVLLDEYARRIAEATPNSGPWVYHRSTVANLAMYGVQSKQWLEVVQSLQDLHDEVIAARQDATQLVATDFVATVERVIGYLMNRARHPMHGWPINGGRTLA